MNKLQSLVCRSVIGAALVGGLGVTHQALALGIGACKPSGGTHAYSFDFTKHITDPIQNKKGLVVENAAAGKWQGGSEYRVDCECDASGRMNESYVSAEYINLGAHVYSKDGWKYYLLPGTDDRLAVATKVGIGGIYAHNDVASQFHAPFGPTSNGWTAVNQGCTNTPYASGSTGTVNLYFNKPFVGETEIPFVTFLNVYISARPEVESTMPVATVSMSGRVSVLQSCQLTPSAISIPFGDIMSNSFNVAPGQMPADFSGREFSTTITMDCGNISEGVIVTLALKGESNTHITDALKTMSTQDGTENEDIAIRFTDKDGNIIKPSLPGMPATEGVLPVRMTGLGELNSEGVTEFRAYPISATGKPAKVGEFNATATLNVQLE